MIVRIYTTSALKCVWTIWTTFILLAFYLPICPLLQQTNTSTLRIYIQPGMYARRMKYYNYFFQDKQSLHNLHKRLNRLMFSHQSTSNHQRNASLFLDFVPSNDHPTSILSTPNEAGCTQKLPWDGPSARLPSMRLFASCFSSCVT